MKSSTSGSVKFGSTSVPETIFRRSLRLKQTERTSEDRLRDRCMSIFTRDELNSSSETQGQSVRSGEKTERKFSSKGRKAPGYRLSPDHFQKFKGLPAPDWAQKMLCIILPNRLTHLLSSFRVFVHDVYSLDHGLSGSCTKEMHTVRKLSV